MNELKITILDAATLGGDIDLSAFERYGEVEIHEYTSAADVPALSAGCDILITNKAPVGKDSIAASSRLKLICVAATGANNIDIGCCREKGVAVANAAGYSTASVVQHTFSMALYLIGSTRYYDDYVRSGEYSKNKIFSHAGRPFNEIAAMKWGVIGLGAIGSGVAKIASAFGASVSYYSTSGKNINGEYKSEGLDELLKSSDMVSIHAPLNEKTKDLIRYRELSMMKPSAVILNVGRGGIINETDLVRALNEKKIRAAGLDVMESEPLAPQSPLHEVDDGERLLITPHMAWTSVEARKRLVNEIALNIEFFLKGERRNRLDLK